MHSGCILKISLVCLYFPLLICYSYNQCQAILHANSVCKTENRVLTPKGFAFYVPIDFLKYTFIILSAGEKKSCLKTNSNANTKNATTSFTD